MLTARWIWLCGALATLGTMAKEICSPAGIMFNIGKFIMLTEAEAYADLTFIVDQINQIRDDTIGMITNGDALLELLDTAESGDLGPALKAQTAEAEIPETMMDVDIGGDAFGHYESMIQLKKNGKEAFKSCADLKGRLPQITDDWKEIIAYAKLPTKTAGEILTKQHILTIVRLADATKADSMVQFIDMQGHLQGEKTQAESGATTKEIDTMKTGAVLLKTSTIEWDKPRLDNIIKTNDADENSFICMTPLSDYKDSSVPLDVIRGNIYYMQRIAREVQFGVEELLAALANVASVFFPTDIAKVEIARSRSLQNLAWVTRHLKGTSPYVFTMKTAEGIGKMKEYWAEVRRVFEVKSGKRVTLECPGKDCISDRVELDLISKQGNIYKVKQLGPAGVEGVVFSLKRFANKNGMRSVGKYLYMRKDGEVTKENFYDEHPTPEYCILERNVRVCTSLPIPLTTKARCGAKMLTGDAEATDCTMEPNTEEDVMIADCSKGKRIYYTPPRYQLTTIVCGSPEVEEERWGAETISADLGCAVYNDLGMNVLTQEIREGKDDLEVVQNPLKRSPDQSIIQLEKKIIYIQFLFGGALGCGLLLGAVATCMACDYQKRGKRTEKRALREAKTDCGGRQRASAPEGSSLLNVNDEMGMTQRI